jgi:hypothetical protein
LLVAAPLVVGTQSTRSNFDERVLASHNRERAALGLPLLRWSPELASNARQWSEHLARTGRFEHSQDSADEEQQGENLWAGTRGYYAPESMVGLWLSEKRHFKKGVFPLNSNTGKVEDVGHYTQLVWRGSGAVGCALSEGAAEDVLVCRYSAAGNVLGQVPY